MQSVTRNVTVSILVLFAITTATSSECPPFYIFTGEASGDNFGSVALAGDVNNDGFADIIVGAPGNDAAAFNAGRAYVISGQNGDTLYVFTGESAGDSFGGSVASAGDVNNDGYDDLIVGAWANNVGGSNAGRAYVYSGLDGITLHVFTGEDAHDNFGTSVASAGDVDNDGYDDLIIGARQNSAADFYAGRAYVFSGKNGDTIYVFTGEAQGDQLGMVASAGDINNDGFADVIVGAFHNSATGVQAGRAYVFSGLNGDTLFVFSGESDLDEFGWSVASAGDVNNDGYDDLIVGASRNDAGGPNAGRAYVFSGLNGDTLFVFTGEAATDRFGSSVSSAGDVNGDGFVDLMVGAWGNDAGGLNAGRVYVYSGLSGDSLFVFTGESTGDFFGRNIAPVEDVNNDGFADMIVGAPRNDASGSNSGRAYVFLGADLDCGDVNGDGHVSQDDVTFLISYYFSFGESPCGFSSDVNEDGFINLVDIVYLAQYLNNNGPAPCENSEPPPSFDPKKEPEGRQTGPTAY